MPLLDDVNEAIVATARIRNILAEGPFDINTARDVDNLRLAIEANAALTELAEALRTK